MAVPPQNPAAEGGSKKRSTYLFGTILVVLSLAVTFGFLEAAVRVLHIQPPPAAWDPNVPDAVLGMKPAPHVTEKAAFKEYAGTIYLKTNNLSFYEAEDTQPAPAAGVKRIVVMGDSHTVGACNAEESFPNLWEQKLNEGGQGRYEVINAGVGRYSPYQNYVRFEREILPLRPAHVVVALYPGNDFLDMIRQDDRPYLTKNADGTFTSHPPRFVAYRDPNAKPGLIERSRVARIAINTLQPTLLYQISRVKIVYENLTTEGHSLRDVISYLWEVRKLDKINHGLMLQSLHQQYWFARFPDTLPKAIEVNRYAMKLFRDRCRERGIRLTYLVLATKPVIEPEDLADTYAALRAHDPQWTAERIAGFDNRLIDQALKDARDLGIEAVDFRAGMLARKRAGELMFYHEDTHTAVPGNRAIAEILMQSVPRPGEPAVN